MGVIINKLVRNFVHPNQKNKETQKQWVNPDQESLLHQFAFTEKACIYRDQSTSSLLLSLIALTATWPDSRTLQRVPILQWLLSLQAIAQMLLQSPQSQW